MPIFQASLAIFFLSFCSFTYCAQHLTGLFDGQRLVHASTEESGAHLLTLSSLKKINSEWVAEREELLEGKLDRRTLELNRPYTLDSAWNAVARYFVARNASLIFECLGLACGSSNAWANERFGVKQLYGLDLSQRYQVWQINGLVGQSFASVYLVQRGNKRIYFHADYLLPLSQDLNFAPSAEVIARRFYRDGQIEVSGLSFEEGDTQVSEPHIRALAGALNQQPFRSLTIVGHDFAAGTGDEQRQRSIAYARVVYEALVSHGVQPKRMTIEGVGGLAPDGTGRLAKVVILQQAP